MKDQHGSTNSGNNVGSSRAPGNDGPIRGTLLAPEITDTKEDNKLSKEELAVLKKCYRLLLQNAHKANKEQNKIEDADELVAPEASPISESITSSDDSVSLHENVEMTNDGV